jgi:putative NADPH-quinone reductase
MPALLKGFLEHIFRPGFAMGIQEAGLSEAAAGRALRPHNRHHGQPVLPYRWYFGAYGVRGFERSMLGFAGIKPIRENFYGLCFADEKKRSRWLDEMRDYGRRAR